MRQDLIDEIMKEREHQDEKWGGPEHDDKHFKHHWFNFITPHIDRAKEYIGCGRIVREELIKIAALAIAAIESYDRMYGEPKEDEIEYKRYQSLSGDWYNIPDDENYTAQVSGYTYAVLISDENMMLWYEEGNTGWVLVEEE